MTLTHGRLLSHSLVWEQICCSAQPKLYCSFHGTSFLLEVPYWREDSWEEKLDSNFQRHDFHQKPYKDQIMFLPSFCINLADFNFPNISDERDFHYFGFLKG